VQIGIPDDYADRLLPRLLAAFARTYPKIEVAVTCRETSAVARMVDAGELDLAILSGGDEGVGGQVFRRERLLWVGSEHHAAHLLDPLPLALGPQSCNWRQCAIDALDAIDRAYRIAYVSGSAAPLSGAVLAGLAVSTLPESAVRPGMRILRSEDGFPLLPPCDIVLMRARHATQATHEALVDHILHNLSNLGPSNLGPSNLSASTLEAARQAAE
jgi:DNA-binding transcriptional LysR family regulator